ncbi:uncharacterized protein DUF3343 [Klebsiella oxytoca]|uniref:Uncharacterized protein DUF3343 n=1 Tax=Klebsiella oxytoca TaxID=571 RepID=A0A318FZ96_KLEOX|nr:DUF3343 domain-containing protein [Klebsiella oxytoca]PXW48744.1 uncharacterized protein DUF3343 [Klebsiella oxytoca]HCB1497580.1 DUF3343 domain-containing protein [Klebsiella michiganensis]HCB1844777.1 DUF3343 domain-containing protein [Klebsiella oxytoca]
MTEYLFLFHSTVGVVRMRKALQAAGMTFRVKDIPRQLRGGCGLCIYLSCEAGEEQRWVVLGETQAIHHFDGEAFELLHEFPPAVNPTDS